MRKQWSSVDLEELLRKVQNYSELCGTCWVWKPESPHNMKAESRGRRISAPDGEDYPKVYYAYPQPQMKFKGVKRKPHMHFFEPGTQVVKTCETKNCVNPDHWRPKDEAEIADPVVDAIRALPWSLEGMEPEDLAEMLPQFTLEQLRTGLEKCR
jgi:hypothetical protein